MISNKKILEGLLEEPMFGTQKDRLRQVLEQMKKERYERREEIRTLRVLVGFLTGLYNNPNARFLKLLNNNANVYLQLIERATACLSKHKL